MKSSTSRAWAQGGMVFAATMLIVVGVYQALMGLAAVINDQFFIIVNSYAYSIDVSAWGWIHMGIGILAIAVCCFIFSGATWARITGIVVAGLSAVANFFFLPYYPVWSLVVIAMDIFAIWALATVRMDEPIDSPAMMESDAGMAYPYAGQEMGAHAAERWPSANQPADRWATEQARDATGAPQPAPMSGMPEGSGTQGSGMHGSSMQGGTGMPEGVPSGAPMPSRPGMGPEQPPMP